MSIAIAQQRESSRTETTSAVGDSSRRRGRFDKHAGEAGVVSEAGEVLLHVSSLSNSWAVGGDLSFKSETVLKNEEVRLTVSVANAPQTLC